jgi:hypothetical protein
MGDIENPNTPPVVETKAIDVVTDDDAEQEVGDRCQQYTKHIIVASVICILLWRFANLLCQ